MGLLATFLIVLSLSLQVQAHEELSKEGILCITQNQEKTALGRWLHCLQTSPSSNTQDAEADPFQIIEDSALEHFIEQEEAGQLTESKDNLAANNSIFGDGEESKGALRLDNENDSRIETTRSHKEDILLSWLKLNLAILALCRLLFGLFKRCSWKMAHEESSELNTMNVSEDSLEAVLEISKSIIVDDSPSSNPSATANLRMIGSSLGSAVGAVVSEVLLKSCSSGSPAPADKICMILESALKDLSLQVQDDDCCSRLVGDFITSFKSTYSTMYRIHQACASYGGPGVTDSNLKEDNKSSIVKSNCEKECTSAKSCVEVIQRTEKEDNNSFVVKSNCEKECMSAKSCVEVIHTQGTDFEDKAWQVKEELYLQDASAKSKQESIKSSSGPAVDALLELSKCSRPLAAPGEHDSGSPAAFTFSDHALTSNVKTEMHNIPRYVGIEDAFEETLICASAELTDKTLTHLDYEVEDASSVCEEPPSIMQSNAVGRLNIPPWLGQSYGSSPSEFQKVFIKFYERHVRAQEQHNQFKYNKLQHLVKQQNLEEEKIQLTAAANQLMRENIDLGRSKANFRENRVMEQQAKAAHANFCTTCADELAAGLCVMLTTLVYSVRMYSFALLNDLVSMCQPPVKEPRRSVGFHMDWFYNSLDSLAGKLQAIVCHFTVTGRILVGSILVGIVAQSLLRRSVTNSSQAMPATILIIVLGGVCGFVGKVSVDSLGGSGSRWWVVWGTFCLLHALVNCFTPSVYILLHGSLTRPKSKFGPPFWFRRFAFHLILVLFLPLLAGLLPFGTFSCVMNDLFFTSIERLSGVFASVCEWPAQLI